MFENFKQKYVLSLFPTFKILKNAGINGLRDKPFEDRQIHHV